MNAIVFFDLFDYPLTGFEAWKYSSGEAGAVAIALGSMVQEGILETVRGFYFLPGRAEIVQARLKRYDCSVRKMKKASRISRVFKLIPWVKMIAVGNVIGANNLKDGSDIDLFIVAQNGRIWSARFFCVLIAKLLGLRPTEKNSRDKICLSFFVSEDNLDMEILMLDKPKVEGRRSKVESDPYFIHWFAGLVPIFDAGGYFERLIRANHWISDTFPNWKPVNRGAGHISGKSPGWVYVLLFNLLFGRLESRLKKAQMRIFPERIKTLMNKDTRVVISDQILKFHVNDRREEIREKLHIIRNK